MSLWSRYQLLQSYPVVLTWHMSAISFETGAVAMDIPPAVGAIDAISALYPEST